MAVLSLKDAVRCLKGHLNHGNSGKTGCTPKKNHQIPVKKLVRIIYVSLKFFFRFYDVDCRIHVLFFCFASHHPSLTVRKTIKKDKKQYYQKCTIAKGGEECKNGPKTFHGLFQWADRFIEAATQRFGHAYVTKCLMEWQWQTSTCFAGVGCAETASQVIVYYKFCYTYSDKLICFGIHITMFKFVESMISHPIARLCNAYIQLPRGTWHCVRRDAPPTSNTCGRLSGKDHANRSSKIRTTSATLGTFSTIILARHTLTALRIVSFALSEWRSPKDVIQLWIVALLFSYPKRSQRFKKGVIKEYVSFNESREPNW